MKILVENNYAKVWEDNGGLRHKISLVGANLRRGINKNEIIINSNHHDYHLLCTDCEVNGDLKNTQTDVLEALDPFVISGASDVSVMSSNTNSNSVVNGLVSVVKPVLADGIHRLDARESIYNDQVVGAVDGRHYWVLQRKSNTVDLFGTTQPITITAGAKVDVNGLDVEKNVTGNSWNASFYSGQAFDPTVEDFAVSWLVENTTGTIREMGGLDNNPSQNNSYNSMEFAIYQVNNYFYSRVYESGAAIVIPNYTTFYLQVGDRLGIKCVNQVVSYFVLRAGVETIIYTSAKKATDPLYFKGAFNRGNSSSGHSSIGSVEWHTGKTLINNTAVISGNSTDTLAFRHLPEGGKVGIEFNPTCKYSDLTYTALDSDKFKDTNGNIYPLDFTHGFFAGASQSIGLINFD